MIATLYYEGRNITMEMDIPSVEDDLAALATRRIKLKIIDRKPAIRLWQIRNEGFIVRLSRRFINHDLFEVVR